MSKWEIFRWVVLVFLLGLYILMVFFKSNTFRKQVGEGQSTPLNKMTPAQIAHFNRSMDGNVKSMLRFQGWLLVTAAIVLAFFDSRGYIIAAMFCACLSAAYFSRAWRMVT